MSKAEATPRPWFAVEEWILAEHLNDDGCPIVIYVGDDDLKIGNFWQEDDDTREANAELIVRAVNAHDELVEALRAVAQWLDTENTAIDANGASAINRKVHAALAKATGEVES